MGRPKARAAIQTAWAAASNGYLPGWLAGTVYAGRLKRVCSPGLNCYSCPGALFSCPIGAAQSVIGSRGFRFSWYVFGILLATGALVGRFACGWLCPFGWAQELLHKIPFPKKLRSFRGDRALRRVKYGVLAVAVILLPMVWRDPYGNGAPYFCEYLCPSGALMGGIPLFALNEGVRGAAGALFAWKIGLFAALVAAALAIYRPFCKYLCPLGAVYGLLNPLSILRLSADRAACTGCGACAKNCKMNVDPVAGGGSAECIRCGDCVKACPRGALRLGPMRGRKHAAEADRL